MSDLVWNRFGHVDNYVEPFFGSGAVLLNSPRIHRTETVNDIDGFVSNFWRSIARDPEKVAHYADWPVLENDLHARHAWLVNNRDDLVPQLEGDPEYCDPKIAGWWVWGLAMWIGGEFCSGKGPWHIEDGRLVLNGRRSQVEKSIIRKTPEIGSTGRGVHRQILHLGDYGQGVSRRRLHVFRNKGVSNKANIFSLFSELSERLKRVRVCCGDWSRVCGNTPTIKLGLTAVFLDPPDGKDAERAKNIYSKDSLSVSADVRRWAVENGDSKQMRIALCGYEGEHKMPSTWDCIAWKAHGGYGVRTEKGKENATKERIWFSPHCESHQQLSIF